MVGGLFALHHHAPRTRARIAKGRPVFCSRLSLVAISERRGPLVASRCEGHLVVCGAVRSATQTKNDQPWAFSRAPILEIRADAGRLLIGTRPSRSPCRDLRAIRPAGGSNEPAATHAPRIVYAKVIQRLSRPYDGAVHGRSGFAIHRGRAVATFRHRLAAQDTFGAGDENGPRSATAAAAPSRQSPARLHSDKTSHPLRPLVCWSPFRTWPAGIHRSGASCDGGCLSPLRLSAGLVRHPSLAPYYCHEAVRARRRLETHRRPARASFNLDD